MWVIVVCLALVLAGLVAVLRWGGLAVEPPPANPNAVDTTASFSAPGTYILQLTATTVVLLNMYWPLGLVVAAAAAPIVADGSKCSWPPRRR